MKWDDVKQRLPGIIIIGAALWILVGWLINGGSLGSDRLMGP